MDESASPVKLPFWQQTGLQLQVVGILAATYTLFQLWTAGWGPFPHLIQRALHVGFALVLTFILPHRREGKKLGLLNWLFFISLGLFAVTTILPRSAALWRGVQGASIWVWLGASVGLGALAWLLRRLVATFSPADVRVASWWNWWFALLTIPVVGHLVMNYGPIMEALGGAEHPWELWLGFLGLALVLEAGRRTTGPILPFMACLGLLYALYGNFIPGHLGHRGFGIQPVIEQLYLFDQGLWGIITGISATTVASFIIFGEVILRTGGGECFMDFSKIAAGRSWGGAAKVATLASALFGMLSGSAVANVATTGNFTIPMMKRLGYRPAFAGAVEATASSGGQITPPIMGAGAFIMSELIGVPYLTIAAAAALPALLFYLSILAAIHFEARKVNLAKVPREQIPAWHEALHYRRSLPLFLPVVAMLTFLLSGYTPYAAAFAATSYAIAVFFFFGVAPEGARILALPVAITLLFRLLGISFVSAGLYAIFASTGLCFLGRMGRSQVREELWRRIRALVVSFESAGLSVMIIATLIASAQVFIAMLNMTGVAVKMSEGILSFSGGFLLVALLLSGLVCLILGMGMPTTAAYIVAAAVVGPALIALKLPDLPAHLFIFYFAILSALTPPVCTAAFTASAISGAPWQSIAWISVKLALMKYVVPFFFIYRPSLLIVTSLDRPLTILYTVLTSMLAAILFGAGTVGYLFRTVPEWARLVLLGAGFFFISPSWKYHVLGAVILGSFYLWQRFIDVPMIQGPLPAADASASQGYPREGRDS